MKNFNMASYHLNIDKYEQLKRFCESQGYGYSEVMKEYDIEKLVIGCIKDELNLVMSVGYSLTQGRSIKKVPYDDKIISWKSFIDGGRAYTGNYKAEQSADDTAVILFSGGTTGVTKGIELTNLNFNALALQTVAMCNKPVKHKKMLAAMPMFHGFGLGVCVHTMMVAGGQSVLVPRFNVKDYAGLIKKHKPNYIAGVPTLYEALTRTNYLDGVSLDSLMGVFSGGDSLSVELKKKLDKFLADHGATVRVREGYGTTECVTASCLTPYNVEKEGSIGFPYPDTYYMIARVGTNEEVPYGEDGEICITGPSVMKGYLNRPEENANTLKVHEDGRIWLHTGDLGVMDENGYIYFKQRIKRMIITSGYNVYPSQIENILEAHEAVQLSCVIGVKDPIKVQKVKAFVVLKEGYEASGEIKESILAHCRANIAKYAMPYDIEFRHELPKTLVGKIAYTELEREEAEKE
jgi:long-chain acyl-CoA synthetase